MILQTLLVFLRKKGLRANKVDGPAIGMSLALGYHSAKGASSHLRGENVRQNKEGKGQTTHHGDNGQKKKTSDRTGAGGGGARKIVACGSGSGQERESADVKKNGTSTEE